MSKTKALLHWTETEQASVVDLSLIREEDRVVGAPTVVKHGQKYHKAIVRLISSDSLKLEEAEENLCLEIEEALQKKKTAELESKRRALRHRKPAAQPGAASLNLVASALGERFKPTSQQAPKVKELTSAKRAATRAQNNAQDDVDREALSESTPRKRLFSDNVNPHDDYLEDNDCQASDDGIDFLEEMDIDETERSVANERSVTKPDSNCCSHCKDLKKALNRPGSMFVKALAIFGNIATSPNVKYAELLPIPDDIPKCELTKDMQPKVYIRISDKSSIKVSAKGDPAKLVRLTLVCLFGRETLLNNYVTALGLRPGTLGVRENVRNAMRYTHSGRLQ
ncbi:uncharacterized protein LOC117642373 [Thrips palmi]|uniref:Uncharacterized protein LOC117642373 n=1 Tax=Thrips palmi TaxID=161013 RepID=A0A6P8YHC2_THRPL|nr:uncharacterized protein LOC117642373 [Thrips palmi]